MINTILLVLILVFTLYIWAKTVQWEDIRKDLQRKLDEKEKQDNADFVKNYYINEAIRKNEIDILPAIRKDEAKARLKEIKEVEKMEKNKKD